jgi:hypothetical protein
MGGVTLLVGREDAGAVRDGQDETGRWDVAGSLLGAAVTAAAMGIIVLADLSLHGYARYLAYLLAMIIIFGGWRMVRRARPQTDYGAYLLGFALSAVTIMLVLTAT